MSPFDRLLVVSDIALKIESSKTKITFSPEKNQYFEIPNREDREANSTPKKPRRTLGVQANSGIAKLQQNLVTSSWLPLGDSSFDRNKKCGRLPAKIAFSNGKLFVDGKENTGSLKVKLT